MKTKRTIIAACIATLFISGTVFAKDTWEYHESGWNNVKSYGKVVVAQDSVGQWGPWEDFVEPAAGAPAPVAMPGMSGGDQYRNIPNIIVIPEDKGCAAGAWCGYAIFRNAPAPNNERERSIVFENPYPYEAALFNLMPKPEDSNITPGRGFSLGSLSWQLTSLGTLQPMLNISGGDIPGWFGGNFDGLHHFHVSDSSKTDNGWEWNMANGWSHFGRFLYSDEAKDEINKGAFAMAVKHADPQVAAGDFERQVVNYTSGGDNFKSEGETFKVTSGYYVAGIATPQDYLTSQQMDLRDIRAYYFGGSFDGSRQGTVAIQVQFRPGTWSGQWVGPMNFQVTDGKIVGANIVSSTVSALIPCDPATYKGTVQGTFYGAQAGSIGGVSSVTQTYTPKPIPSVATVAVNPPQPVSITNNAIFLVNKVYSGPAVQPK